MSFELECFYTMKELWHEFKDKAQYTHMIIAGLFHPLVSTLGQNVDDHDRVELAVGTC
jgi:hypothetical protein